MSRQRTRGRTTAAPASPYDQARDELFQHVMRCGVIGSAPEHQTEWFDETMKYLADRYHELSKKEIGDLRVLGERFAAPTVTPEDVAPATPTPPPEPEASADAAESGELDTVNAA
jgi:hypothetical protein